MMNNDTNESEILDTSTKVWNYLIVFGGLKPKTYDLELENAIRRNLNLTGLPDSVKFEILLKNLPVEDLIVAFFQAVQPFAQMMTDLLVLFESAALKQSNHNIGISFNFSKNLPELKFDLNHFKSWHATLEKCMVTRTAYTWQHDSFWGFNDLFSTKINDPQDANFERWKEQYDSGVWPNIRLESPKTGHLELDQKIGELWALWEAVKEQTIGYGIPVKRGNRDSIMDANRGEASEIENIRVLFQIQIDHWIYFFARKIYAMTEEISFFPPDANFAAASSSLQRNIDIYLNRFAKIQIRQEELIEKLIAFLQIPLWRHRYELYSTWVFSQIVDALHGHQIKIHQSDGTLKFSFAGSHLATVDDLDPRLHIWCELRSPLENPISKHRKNAIQPDYTLLHDPISSPESALIVIECKQYKKASSRNFSEALIDYSKGRPNAEVILVNYGPAPQRILEILNSGISHDRAHLIGNFYPGSNTDDTSDAPEILPSGSKYPQTAFKELLQKIIREKYGKQSSAVPLQKIEKVTLTWKELPSDLDLYLRIESADALSVICYRNAGDSDNFPYAQYLKDERDGFGPETIEIARVVQGTYEFAVNNLSNEIPLTASEAVICLFQAGQLTEIRCPQHGEGQWWHIGSWDTATNQFELVNRIVKQIWQE